MDSSKTIGLTIDEFTSSSIALDSLTPVPIIPSPKDVTGKEYSNNVDKDSDGNADPGQTLNWAGDGSTSNGFEYWIGGQVDAMSNSGDAFFQDVINNQATLVFSTSFDDRIFYETTTGFGGVWAKPEQIDQPGPGMDLGVNDVDGLELWGPTDANRFSVYGDPYVAVYDYDPATGTSAPLYRQKEIARAIGVPAALRHLVNLDAMMTFGKDQIMFSIDPIEQLGLDGGEIWVWNRGAGAAAFLNHGGHIWNTAFDVMGTFGTDSENINALEAIGTNPFNTGTVPDVDLTFDPIELPDVGVFDPSDSKALLALDRVTSETVFSDGERYFTLDLDGKELSLSDLIRPDREEVTPPKQVYGKEYSNSVDKDTFGNADPGQTLTWVGDGTTADGFDYLIRGQVDAIANNGDAFFSSVIQNQATLVFSTSFDDEIYYETPVGANNVWATAAEIDQPGPGIDLGVTDVDGLELWGPTDANRFSVYGDHRYAVYDFDPLTGTKTGLYTRKEISKAIGVPNKYSKSVNVDAMMTSGDDLIMFSIDPIEGLGLDGGEIWVWDRNSGLPAQFLNHGGHVWDTAFDVKGTFGTASENVNALEAIGNYGGALDAGFDPIFVDRPETIGSDAVPVFI